MIDINEVWRQYYGLKNLATLKAIYLHENKKHQITSEEDKKIRSWVNNLISHSLTLTAEATGNPLKAPSIFLNRNKDRPEHLTNSETEVENILKIHNILEGGQDYRKYTALALVYYLKKDYGDKFNLIRNLFKRNR